MSDLLATKVNTSPESKLVHGSTCLMLDDRDSYGLAAKSSQSSPSSPSRPVKDEITHRSSSINSSPNADRLDAISKNPTWCGPRNSGFVRSSGTKDDPFVTDSPTAQSTSRGKLNPLLNKIRADILSQNLPLRCIVFERIELVIYRPQELLKLISILMLVYLWRSTVSSLESAIPTNFIS